MKFFRQGFQTTRNFRNFLHAVVAALRRTLEQLEIVDDDEADTVTPLQTPRAGAQSGDRQARRVVDKHGQGLALLRGAAQWLELLLADLAHAQPLARPPRLFGEHAPRERSAESLAGNECGRTRIYGWV